MNLKNYTPRLITLALVISCGAATILYFLKKNSSSENDAIVIFGEDSSNLKAYRSLAEEFAGKTGITPEFEGATFEQSLQKADADFRSGSGKYDIVLQYNFSLAPYVKNRYVAGMTEAFSLGSADLDRINKELFKNALLETSFYYGSPENNKSEPQQFGFPFASNTMLLAYNKGIFENEVVRQKFKAATGKDLSVPDNWGDYLIVAEFISKSGQGLQGVCLQGAGGGWLYYELSNYLFSMGTGTSSKHLGWEEGAALTISSPQNEEVLRYLKKMRAFSSGDFFTVDAAKQQELMLQGKTAMALVWSDYVQPLAESKGPTFGFAPIPGKISGLAGGAFYINKKSRRMNQASKFVLFALEPKNQSKLIEKGLCSPLKTAYTDDVLNRVPYAKALYQSLDRGVFMFEAGSDAEIISSALTSWTQKYIRGEVSETDALKNAQDEVEKKRKGAL